MVLDRCLDVVGSTILIKVIINIIKSHTRSYEAKKKLTYINSIYLQSEHQTIYFKKISKI